MEKEPKFENENKRISERQLIQLLKEKGAEDSEVKEILIKWTKEQEKKVKESNDPEAPINFNVQRARLYSEAGYYKEAYENFEAAQTQAYQEGRDELYQEITEEINEIKNILEKDK
jgi:hypothetical protein